MSIHQFCYHLPPSDVGPWIYLPTYLPSWFSFSSSIWSILGILIPNSSLLHHTLCVCLQSSQIHTPGGAACVSFGTPSTSRLSREMLKLNQASNVICENVLFIFIHPTAVTPVASNVWEAEVIVLSVYDCSDICKNDRTRTFMWSVLWYEAEVVCASPRFHFPTTRRAGIYKYIYMTRYSCIISSVNFCLLCSVYAGVG